MRNRMVSLVLVLLMVLSLMPAMSTPAHAVINPYWPVPGHIVWDRDRGLHGTLYNNTPYKNAIDISDSSINGAPVIASMGGTVIRMFTCAKTHYGSDGDCLGFGTGLVISGDDGKTYQYAHLQAESIPNSVYVGVYVSRGQRIGSVGMTGNATGPHLHFGISNTSKFWENGDPTPGSTNYDHIAITKPTSATISIDKDELAIGETFTLRCTANQLCDSYFISIFDADSGEKITDGQISSSGVYHNSFLKCGHYTAYMSATNSKGTADSNWIHFYVFGGAPTNSTLSIAKTGYSLGSTVTLQSTSNNYYSRYYVAVLDENGNTTEGYQRANYAFKPNTYGTYAAHMSAYTPSGTAHSNWVTFRVFGKYIDLGNSFYANISNTSAGKNLDVLNDSAILQDQNNSESQIWKFIKLEDGSYLIENAAQGTYLSAVDQMDVTLSDANAAQHWYLETYAPDTDEVLFASYQGDYSVMYPKDGETESGTHLAMSAFSGKARERFRIQVIEYQPIALSITLQPQDIAAESDQTVQFSVEAAGNGLTYRWQYLPADASEWMNCTETGSDTETLQISAAATRTGHRFRCVVTDVFENTVISNAATLTVSEPEQTNPFTDVIAGKFYYNAVLWAQGHDPQITSGVTATTFEPDRFCTRAHVVTFLWRANGCPEPTTAVNPFKDVPSNKYFYQAVLWAAENGITTGYSDGTFRPDEGCTRGQVVTFLWRSKGAPAPTSTTNLFSDVENGKYYTQAVLWALENNITTGKTATTFAPDDICTRGHAVTFLYRTHA